MSDQTIGDGLSFWKKYNLIEKTFEFEGVYNFSRICRFCGLIEPNISFRTEAHSCPELLGENNFLNYEECDNCNNKFSAFESHLSKFFLPYLSVLRIKGKKKVPEFHSRTENKDERTRTILRVSDQRELEFIIGQEDDLHIDHNRKLMSIRFRLPPHKPLYVYKALVKIGLSILPKDKLLKYRNIFHWLMDQDNDLVYFPFVFITYLNRKKFSQPYAELFECINFSEENCCNPELTLILNFGNLVAQIFLPFSSDYNTSQNFNKTLNLELYPAFIMYNINKQKFKDYGPTDLLTVKYSFTTVELASDLSMVRDEILNFSFQEIQII